MEAGAKPPDRDPPAPHDTVHESERTRITRLVLSGRTVICKEPLGPDADRRRRHERAVLERLRGVPGVAQLVTSPNDQDAILLADGGGTSLAEHPLPLAPGELVGLAAELARAVAGMHARGVMHRDIAPANIVLSRDGAPCLVDFALATSLAELRPEFTHHTEILGTLAYIAPEQTGRTGRAVDQRADLYALGATLYELATGEPPFGSGDPLRLTHDHLARVPAPPAEANPAVPPALSAIILHLLEKEPDNRYQSAEGVLHDLEQLRAGTGPQEIGERDVPLRLPPPSRLVGRDDEVAVLRAAFEESLAGGCRGVLVSGAPGVGKTALVDQLRSEVTGSDGWFVAGTFDQYRRDLEFNAAYQAFRALGRLLLAEPESELVDVRGRLSEELGPNAPLIAAILPEFAALLATPPDPGDPLSSQVRTQRAGAAILRAIASRDRPVVVFLDDLQWGDRALLGLVDLVLSEERVDGVLLVAAYRETEVDAAYPLTPLLSRWREQNRVRHLRLENLPGSGSVAMVAEMLHVDRRAAADLVDLIDARTAGNPYEIVELLNALRRDGVLTPTAAGWQWDEPAVRARLDRAEVAGLLAARARALPQPSRELAEAMACLGGRVELTVLQAATGDPAAVVEERLAPALGEGVLVAEPGTRTGGGPEGLGDGKDEAVRFRHDRMRDAVLSGLNARRRRTLHLTMARRLAGVPELHAVAAEQYLPVIDAVTGPTERRDVVRLLRRATDQAWLVGDYAMADQLLTAALNLVEPDEAATLVELHVGRHRALYSMGRLEEADAEFRTIDGSAPSATARALATAVQVRSLTHRKRFADAASLGVASLRELGITVPPADRLDGELDRQFDHLYRWLDSGTDDTARPAITDPRLLAATHVLNALLPTTYYSDHAMFGWLSLEAVRIWRRHGPSPTLVGPVSIAAFNAIALRGDTEAGYRAVLRVLALGEARAYEPGTSQARYVFACLAWWREPIENGVGSGRRAMEGLVAGDDLANAGYSLYATVPNLLDCAPSLDSFVEEVEAGLTFVRRTGSEEIGQWLGSYRWLVDVLRGEGPGPGGRAAPVDRFADNPVALLVAHLTRGIAAAVFGDADGLAEHAAAAMPLLPAALGLYPTAVAHLLHGLALAGQVRAAGADERIGLLAELDDVTRWLGARAADAPDNFLHLQRLVEAERAWAIGDFRTAAVAFDAARREGARRQRPWHQALITERAARFSIENGLDHTGYELLSQARAQYAAWGATAKAGRLDWAYPAVLPPAGLPERRSTVTSGTLDLLGVLSASQALSSETGVERLHTRVVEVLSAMTGATEVHLLFWNDDRNDWVLPAPQTGATGPAVPTSVLRYARRLREPLVVADATRDDRFARDPYFAGLGCCSLLAIPVLSQGALRAVLLLENHLIRGAFTADRLDAVTLIAGQLAVSLDNAQLYAELSASRARLVAAADHERRRIERDLHDGAQQRLVSLALHLDAAQAAVPPDLDALAAHLRHAVAEANGAADELRETARGIHPAILVEGGLSPALRILARRAPIPVDLDIRTEGRLPEQVEVSAYYIVAEALTNAAKHARASSVTVIAEADPARAVLRIIVRDDGTGGAELTRGTGLVGLKDRVEAIGGRVRVDSPPGAGTRLSAELPLSAVGGSVTSR
ncbi:putative ATPase [Pseudonocardia hierapolitana]|uniref:Putative ATPase n=1 Tax=Pseudonocardia hierapolitana TaxID=1128676 RepID=A0A561SVR0_9PSEU|nr:AAA family ATPase [Pseudonocardia hierapolitana]TWF78947.1 putative ATPase [Pseudonocardia hierapolitana]